MLRENIVHTLPKGVGQPLLSRVLTGERTLAWVRSGDIRRVGNELVFEARWDGEGFRVLWDTAITAGPAERKPIVQFAVVVDGHLRILAEVELGDRLQREASRASREAEKARRGWRVGRRW